MATDYPTATRASESEPLSFRTLLDRLHSAMRRLKLSADYLDWNDVPEKYASAVFVIQKLLPELERLEEELS